ncbi:MAG: TlpA disulfide reductase family protein [Chloroflexota bacterium]
MFNNRPTKNTNSEGNRQNLPLIIFEIGLLCVIAAFLIFGGRLFDDADNTSEGLTPFDVAGAVQAGQAAPDFTLITAEGEQITLSELRGRPVIINFWATWCAPCRFEMPELQETFEDYAGNDLELLAINREEDKAQIDQFFVELSADEGIEFTFPALLDSQAKVAESYGVFNMPTTFFVDAEGTVSAVHFGPLVRSQIDEYLADALAVSSN